jgi:hypothetical protein
MRANTVSPEVLRVSHQRDFRSLGSVTTKIVHRDPYNPIYHLQVYCGYWSDWARIPQLLDPLFHHRLQPSSNLKDLDGRPGILHYLLKR